MPRSFEAEAWFDAVYAAVQQIPSGRVTTYKHIATLLGKPQCPRQVGVCLKHLPSFSDTDTDTNTVEVDETPFYNTHSVPWQRVINSQGGISPRGPGGAERQATALRAEGVRVDRGVMGEFTVDLGVWGWFPEELPDEADDEEGSGNGSEE